MAAEVDPQPRWKRLYTSTARALSYLGKKRKRFVQNYHPNYAFDGDPSTGWVEGEPGLGVGDFIEWRISSLASARAIKIRIKSGYHKSPELFRANAAPKDVDVLVESSTGVVLVTTHARLEHSMEWQELVLDTSGKRDIGWLSIILRSAYPGTTYQDTVISEIETWVDSDVEYKPDVEKAKDEDLKAWIVDGVEQAAYFVRLPKSYPFVSTHFSVKSEVSVGEESQHHQGKKNESFVPLPEQLASRRFVSKAASRVANVAFLKHIDALEALTAGTREDAPDGSLVRPAFRQKARLPSGFYFPGSLMIFPWMVNFLVEDNVSYRTASKDEWVDVRRYIPIIYGEFDISRVRTVGVSWADAKKTVPSVLLLQETSVGAPQDSNSKSAAHHMLRFEGSRLRDIISRTNDLAGGSFAYCWAHFHENKRGKVDRIDIKDISFSKGPEFSSNAFASWIVRSR